MSVYWVSVLRVLARGYCLGCFESKQTSQESCELYKEVRHTHGLLVSCKLAVRTFRELGQRLRHDVSLSHRGHQFSSLLLRQPKGLCVFINCF